MQLVVVVVVVVALETVVMGIALFHRTPMDLGTKHFVAVVVAVVVKVENPRPCSQAPSVVFVRVGLSLLRTGSWIARKWLHYRCSCYSS